MRVTGNRGGLGAIAYVVLFIVGYILALGGSPDTNGPPAKLIAYWSKSSHRDRVSFGWLLVLLGVFFLIWFLAALRRALVALDPDGYLTGVATIGGTVYAALTLVGIALLTGVWTMSDDTYQHQVYPSLIHAASDAGYVMHASGGVGAAAMIVAATFAAARAGVVPRWTRGVAIFFALCAILSIVFFTQLAIVIWLIAAGWLVTRGFGAAAEPAGAQPPV